MKNMAAMPRWLVQVNWEFLLPLGLLLVNRLPWVLPDATFYPIHDTNYLAQVFNYLYREYYLNGEIALWAPLNYYGIVTTLDYINTSPSQYFMMAMGKWFQIKDTLALFLWGIVVEEMAFLVGLHLLARHLYVRRLTVALVGLIGVGTVFWATQLFFNFRLYYLVPYVLLFLLRFASNGGWQHLLWAALLFLMMFMGNATYFAPLYLVTFLTFVLVLGVGLRRQWRPDWSTFRRWDTWLLLLAVVVLGMTLYQLMGHAFEETVSYSRGRNPDKTVDLATFLSYGLSSVGSRNLGSLFGIIYPFSFQTDWSLYLGPAALAFILLALVSGPWPLRLVAVMVTFVVLLLVSIPSSGFPELLYRYFPGMNYYRHLEHVRSLAKLFGLLLAGYGLEVALRQEAGWQRLGIGGLLLLLLLGGEQLIAHDILPYKGPPTAIINVATSIQIQISLLVMILVLILTRPAIQLRWRTLAQAAVLLLVAGDMMGYQWLLAYTTKVNLDNYTIQADSSNQKLDAMVIRHLRSPFHVHPYDFPWQRERQAVSKIQKRSSLLVNPYGMLLYNIYSTADMDPCFQDFRIEFLPRGMDQLLRARMGKAPEERLDEAWLHDTKKLSADPVLLRAMGCESPKIYLARGAEFAPDFSTALRMVRDSEKIDMVPVLLAPGHQEHDPGQLADQEAGGVTVLHYAANTVEVKAQVTNPGGSWLIYADAYHPGWGVTVNGAPRDIVRANLAFKGVYLPPGDNLVRFHFDGVGHPAVLVWILVVFGLVGTIALGWSIVWLLLSRRAPRVAMPQANDGRVSS